MSNEVIKENDKISAIKEKLIEVKLLRSLGIEGYSAEELEIASKELLKK